MSITVKGFPKFLINFILREQSAIAPQTPTQGHVSSLKVQTSTLQIMKGLLKKNDEYYTLR
jgi:hypothetical protein